MGFRNRHCAHRHESTVERNADDYLFIIQYLLFVVVVASVCVCVNIFVSSGNLYSTLWFFFVVVFEFDEIYYINLFRVGRVTQPKWVRPLRGAGIHLNDWVA